MQDSRLRRRVLRSAPAVAADAPAACHARCNGAGAARTPQRVHSRLQRPDASPCSLLRVAPTPTQRQDARFAAAAAAMLLLLLLLSAAEVRGAPVLLAACVSATCAGAERRCASPLASAGRASRALLPLRRDAGGSISRLRPGARQSRGCALRALALRRRRRCAADSAPRRGVTCLLYALHNTAAIGRSVFSRARMHFAVSASARCCCTPREAPPHPAGPLISWS